MNSLLLDAPTVTREAAGRTLAEISKRAKADSVARGKARTAEKARQAAEAPKAEPTPTGPAKVLAVEWATRICGRLYAVATPDQRSRAVLLLNQDHLGSTMIQPEGPSIAELEALLAASKAAKVEAAPVVAPVDTEVSTPAPLKCYLVVEITGVVYDCRRMDAGCVGTKAWALGKRSGDHAEYHVYRGHDGCVHCDCADATFRREGITAEPCRHGRALVALGLLEAPAPVMEPAEVAERHPAPVANPPKPKPAPKGPKPQPVPAKAARPFGIGVEPCDCQDAPGFADDVLDALAMQDAAYHPLGFVLAEPAPSPAPEPANLATDRSGTMTLAEWISHQSGRYRLLETEAGDLVACTLDGLAETVRFVSATRPDQVEERASVLGIAV